MMNMQKLGTVLSAGNYFQLLLKSYKQRDCGLMCYTLCEQKYTLCDYAVSQQAGQLTLLAHVKS